MRLFLISLLSLFFLSSCGDQKKVVGEWKKKGNPKIGLLFLKNGTGTGWNSDGQQPFEWRVEKKVIKIKWLYGGGENTVKVEDDQLFRIEKSGQRSFFYERAK